MSQFKEIRKRIKSIQNTAKITHAMELIAATKMRKAQNATLASRDYTQAINLLINIIANQIHPEAHPLLAKRPIKNTLIILFSTDRGLTGALNSNLNKETLNQIRHWGQDSVTFITIGRKGRQFLIKMGAQILADFPNSESVNLSLIRPVVKLVTTTFLNKEFDQVLAIYAHFVSTFKQMTVTKQILPIREKALEAKIAQTNNTDFTDSTNFNEVLFEPNADVILATILPNYLLTELYQIALEAKASEHSARMIAMKNATDSANELAEDLTLTYNSLRQENITKEILDMSALAFLD